MSAAFELSDRRTRNLLLDVDRLDQVLVALRDLVDAKGSESVDGLSLLAVSGDGDVTMTLAEDAQLVNLLTAASATQRRESRALRCRRPRNRRLG